MFLPEPNNSLSYFNQQLMKFTNTCMAALLVISVLFASCKKDNDAPFIPPVPVDPNVTAETKAPVLTPVANVTIGYDINGYYKALPFNYSLTSKNYPLLVFIHGGGQYGNGGTDLPLLLNDGFAQLLDAKTFPANFNVKGKDYSFIVLTPQFARYPSNEDVKVFIDYAKKNFRIDTSRMYIAGLSIGGAVSADVAGAYPGMFAAIVPMAGESQNMVTCSSLAKNNIAVWNFHNSNDPLIGVSESHSFIAWINSNNPGIVPKQTIFQSNLHDAWSKAIDPAYKENNMNIYEWMLQYAK
jgi:predicted peptidase